jgi:hypothetical protein
LFTNVAAVTVETAVIALIMFLFRSSTVLGLFLNTLLPSNFHRKKSSGVTSGDGGGQSHFEIILSPQIFLISPQGWLDA